MLTFLLSFVLSSAFAEVVFPDAEGEFRAVSFMPSALAELREEGKFVLFDEEGVPYGFIDEGEFAETIKYGGLELFAPDEKEGVVVGGSNLGDAAKGLANMRFEQGTDVDWDLLREQDFTKYAYYSQRYGSLENYLTDGLGLDTKSEAVDFLNGLEPSAANEFLDVFRALEGGQVGFSHYKELMEALEHINMDELSEQLDPETLAQLEEFMDEVQKEMAKDVIDEVLKNIGPEELELLYKILKELDYSTLYEIARDYVRELARDGTLDEIGEALSESEVPKEVVDSFGNAASEMLKNRILDFLPKNFAYYLLGAAVVVLVWSLRSVGG